MDQTQINEDIVSAKPKRKGFHPKRFLKNLQSKLQTSPYLYLIFCFLVPVILMYGVYVVKGIFPFYNGSPLVLDLNAQYVSFFEALRDFVLGERSILYSFSRSLGGEFMGMVAYYMASPLTYITVLFPKDRIQEAVLAIMLLKCGLSAVTFAFYLHKKSRNPKKLTIFTFSLMYALSAYAVVQQHNTMWIDALIWLPLFAYGLEDLVYRKKYKLYVISLAVIMVCNYYIGFMVCIFAILYFFYCYFSKSKTEVNPYGEKLHFVRAGLRFAFFSILAAAISAFMLIAAYYSLQFGKTEFSSPNWTMEANFDVVDFLAKFLPGSYDTVEPAGLPFVYCGLLTLLLLPIYFLSKKITPREKIASIALIGALVLSLILKPLDLIWHGFSMPNWLNSRYSFMLCFVLLVIAYKAFGNIQKTGEKFVLGTAAFLILFAAVAEKFEMTSFLTSNEKLLTFGCVWFSIAFTIILAIILCWKLNMNHKNRTRTISGILAVVVCAELFCNGIVCFLQLHNDVYFTTYTSYNDHLANLRPVVNSIKERDTSFYRMEKVHHRTKNDSMALGMYGITNSTSTLNQKVIDFVGSLGYTGRSHYTMYNGGTAVGDSLLGIKYVIDHNTSSKLYNLYQPIEAIESEKYTVYENPNALSLAYGVSKNIIDFQGDDYESYFNRYNAMITEMLGSEELVDLFKHVYQVSITSRNCTEDIGLSRNKYTTEDHDGYVILDYVAPQSGYYYFYANASCNEELRINFNSRGDANYLGKDSNHIVIGGYHEEGEPISIKLTVPEGSEMTLYTSYNYLWYFTLDQYNEVFSTLKNGPQFDIDANNSTEDHLTGKISTKEKDQMILTTIPYDKGWNVYVDGKKVETYEALNALMAFDISNSGDHTLELKYWPFEYTVGMIISIIGIITLIAISVLDLIFKKTLFKKRLKAYDKVYFTLDDFDNEDVEPIPEILESNLSGIDTEEPTDKDEPTEEASIDISDDDSNEEIPIYKSEDDEDN